MGGGYLAHAVADHGLRLDAPGAPQGGQGHLDGEKGGLDDVNFLHAGGGGRKARPYGGHLLQQGPIHVGLYGPRAALQGLPKHRLLLQKLPSHAQPLRALAGEDEDEAGRLAGNLPPDEHARVDLAAPEGLQPLHDLCAGVADDGQAVVEVAAPQAGGVADVAQKGTRMATDEHG